MDRPPVKNIVIVGGGTAGWMTANLMAKCWQPQGIEFTLIESPDIGIIGVGEGSTPQLKQFFDFLEIKESQWMPPCEATYKNGIRFCGWSSRPGFSEYFHSFESEVDFKTQPAFFYNCDMRRKAIDIGAHPDDFYLGARLSAAGKGPIGHDNFPFQVGYGYHFDSVLLGRFLRDHAKGLGVEHKEGTVEKVQLSENGDIASLILASGERIEADFFVDCSGFRSVLLQEALSVPFDSFGENLFNDAAVAIQTPRLEITPPHTTATALSSGWAWRIPLRSRLGNGYVYSRRFLSKDAAEKELRSHLKISDDIPARHLEMRVGQVARHWENNCLAVGLAQGFIEPLEATALHLVQETVQGFIDAFELGQFTRHNCEKFNHRIRARFEGVRDYIVAHYFLNSRNDSAYWRENREHRHQSSVLSALAENWIKGKNFERAVLDLDIDRYYTAMSWHSIFAGYGVFPATSQLRPGSSKAHRYPQAAVSNFLSRCSLNFSAHDLLLHSE